MKHCPYCNSHVQQWGKTAKGTIRFFCTTCRRTVTTAKRKDVHIRHLRHELDLWLGGKDSLAEIAKNYHVSRQTFWKRLRPYMEFGFEPAIPKDFQSNCLIIDATYIHGRNLCALIAIDEHDRIYWRFAAHESFAAWKSFFALFPQPTVAVMDGQKGLFAAAKYAWPHAKIQRCQFHVVSFALQILGRHPKDEPSKQILRLLYKLKEVKNKDRRDWWLLLYKVWEERFNPVLAERAGYTAYKNPKLRSVRFLVRKALPNLFTYIDNPGVPNTTNLVEGWVNGAVAESLRLHRGIREYEKRTLVSIVLSHLTRGAHREKSKAEKYWEQGTIEPQ